MRKIISMMAFGLLALPALAATETFKDVAVVDSNCSKKVAANPDAHPRECALKCQASGYVVITSDKKVLKLDPKGNADVVTALKASEKKDHLRADVSGEVEGETLKVTSFKLL